jgi:two-component system sensor histidine kinase UhpB
MHSFSNIAPINILIVEDNMGDLLLLREHIDGSEIRVKSIETADRLEAAISHLDSYKPDIIFLDLYLPDSSGLCSYNELKPYLNGSAVIILSGLSDTKTALEAIANGAQDYLAKGEFDEKLLEKTISYAMERIKSLETLRLANERYHLVAKATQDMLWDWDLLTDKIYRDDEGMRNVYGIGRNNIIRDSNDWKSRIHPEDTWRVSTMIAEIKTSTTRDLFEMEYQFLADTGDYKYIFDRGYIVRNGEGQAIRMIGAAQDITEKRKLEKALQEAKFRQQREIAEATIRGQENERRQLGVELHDNITQILATSKLYLETKKTGDSLQQMITKSKNLITLATQELRKLSHSLLPPSLHNTGLKESLTELTSAVEDTGIIKFEKKWDALDEKLLNDDQQLTIYRIVQEQLNNIIKHAEASKVYISLGRSGNETGIELLIKDNGKGFDPSEKRSGVGLRNIVSRVELFYGHVSIQSRPGHGCELKVIFPVMQAT